MRTMYVRIYIRVSVYIYIHSDMQQLLLLEEYKQNHIDS